MTRQKLYLLFIGLTFLLSCNMDSNDKLIGYYVNNNFDEKPFLAEIPYFKDTLHLKKDLSFSSSFYGTGTYRLVGNELQLESKGVNYGTRVLPIQGTILGSSLKLVLSHDLNYYYQKID